MKKAKAGTCDKDFVRCRPYNLCSYAFFDRIIEWKTLMAYYALAWHGPLGK